MELTPLRHSTGWVLRMRNYAHLTSSDLFPRKMQYLSVNFDLFPTSSREYASIGSDQFRPVPKNHAQIDQFPLVPDDGNWSKTKMPMTCSHFPLSIEGK
jgi:hypothetical protein